MGAVTDPQAREAALRDALLDAIMICEGWVHWKCPKRHREEHLAHLHRLYLVADPRAAIEPAQVATHLGSERQVFVNLLVECDKVISTLDGETTEEQVMLEQLRQAIREITAPHRLEEGTLLDIRGRLNG